MKIIKIKFLKLTNFKGIRSLEISEFDRETNIYGDNGTGKTTVFDAFTWLLFGKDSSDRSQFEIKTLNKNNQVIEKIDHEVEAILVIDGVETAVKRTFREKWVTKRGSIEAEFSGHETLFHWNDVPLNSSEFSAKISNIVDEKVFKMITSPAAFNSLKWQDQRNVLLELSGGITDEEVAAGDDDFELLLNQLVGKDMEEYQKQLKASVSKSKKEIKMIPTRIDEVERSKPEAINSDEVRSEINHLEKMLANVENQLTDKQAAHDAIIQKRNGIKSEIQKKEFLIKDVEHELMIQARQQTVNSSSASDAIKSQIDEKRDVVSKSQRVIFKLRSEMDVCNKDNSRYYSRMKDLRNEWHEVNERKFILDDKECKCPTCKRDFESSDIEEKKAELEKNFNSNKKSDLERINKSGAYYKGLVEENENQIKATEQRISEIEAGVKNVLSEIEELDKKYKSQLDIETKQPSQNDVYELLLAEDIKIPALNKEIAELNSQLEDDTPIDDSELKSQKAELQQRITSLKSQLQIEDQITRANERINELSAEEKQLAQTIADYERDLFTIERFEKAKSNAVEESVNRKFQLVKFKLFETQINGGEVPTCKALINGVPFSDANTASKINAGVDIINILSEYYGVSAPIFIDNRESVVNLIYSPSQIINLIVSEADKKLRVAC